MIKEKKSNIKEIIFREDLPKIIIERKKLSANFEQETEYIQVQAHNIKECERLIDKYLKRK